MYSPGHAISCNQTEHLLPLQATSGGLVPLLGVDVWEHAVSRLATGGIAGVLLLCGAPGGTSQGASCFLPGQYITGRWLSVERLGFSPAPAPDCTSFPSRPSGMQYHP